MFEEDSWLHPNKTPPMYNGFAVPRLPSKVTRAAYIYHPGKEFTLYPNNPVFITADIDSGAISSAPATASSLSPDALFPAIQFPLVHQSSDLAVRIIEPLDIGYHHKSQIAVVEVNAPLHRGKKLVLRTYDPSYLCPDDLFVVSLGNEPGKCISRYDLTAERPLMPITSESSNSDSWTHERGSPGDILKEDLSASTTTLGTDSRPPSPLGWKKEPVMQRTRRSSSSVPHLSHIYVLITFQTLSNLEASAYYDTFHIDVNCPKFLD